MTYIQIVDLVFQITSAVLSLLVLHFIFFAIVGLLTKKRFPKTDKKLKYGIVIPARNEEKVIGNLIASIQKNEYPQDKLHIFVIAHNCTDKTAEFARAAGATVYEYNNPNERTKGYAFKHLFQKIEEDYGTQSFDGFFVLDADNLLTPNYFEKMNDAFVYYNGERVITSYRNSKNFGSNVMSACYGLYFAQGCRLESRGRSLAGCSTRVSGTGYLFSAKVVDKGWNYLTLTEDWEFSADQVLQGRNIVYCDEAMFYDEQPTSNKIMLRQRMRWTKGHLLVFLTRSGMCMKKLFKRTPKGQKANKFSTYDILVNTLPLSVTSTILFILNLILIFMAPLFMPNDYLAVWQSKGLDLLKTTLVGYVGLMALAVLIFICEHKRIQGVSFPLKCLTVLFYPIFMFVPVPMELVCLFKKVGWTEIPHTDTTAIEKVGQTAADKNGSKEK